MEEARQFVDAFNTDYEAKHLAYETQFWGTKMALKSTDEVVYSTENLNSTKAAMEDLLSDPTRRQTAEDLRQKLARETNDTNTKEHKELVKILDIILKTCGCYDMSSAPTARQLSQDLAKLEGDLEVARNRHLTLGYTVAHETNKKTFVEASSVGLRNVMRTSPDEKVRKSAYEGLRSIGPFCLDHGFVDIIKKRIQLAASLSDKFEDYYDYKVTNSEGFGKQKLFDILDTLEQGTRPILEQALKELEERFGKTALEPWNTGFMTSVRTSERIVGVL